MKNIFKYALIASAAFSLAACNDMIESSEPAVDIERTVILTATREGTAPDTRSVRMDDGTTWWGPKEEISVFYGSGTNGGSKFTSNNTTLAETTEFEGSISMSGNKEFWAVFPYSAENSCDGSSIVTVIPSQQTGSEGNFSGNAFPAIGKSNSLTMAFWNICGGIKFFVSRTDIQSVTIKGNNGETLAGKVKVAFNADGHPEVTEVIEGKKEVTLVAPDDGSFKPGKYYYITLLPTALEGGITLTFKTPSEKGEIISDKAQTVKRSVFGALKNIDSKATEWESTVGVPEWVDLGLSVKWATFNVGATRPEEYGDYYAWGETEPKEDYSWSNYKWCNGAGGRYTKYCVGNLFWDSPAPVDNKTVLDPEDDAARVNWGHSWRMPLYSEWVELRENCTWTWTTVNGINGMLITSNLLNFTDKSIFLPASGHSTGSGPFWVDTGGYYWSSSISSSGSGFAWRTTFSSFSPQEVNIEANTRYCGSSVRAVYGDSIPVSSISLNEVELNLELGSSAQLVATIAPSNATEPTVRWVSGDETIVKVDENGCLSAFVEGTTTVTAYTSNGLIATCVVNAVCTPLGISLKDFAEEFVKGLDVWEATIGTVESEHQHTIEEGTAWQNVHFIPIGKVGGDYDDHPGNQHDDKYSPWTIEVGGKVFTAAQAWEIAVRGLFDMVLTDGQGYISKMTSRNEPGYNLGDNMALSEIIIKSPSPYAVWAGHPWYEEDGMTYNGEKTEEVGIDFITKATLGHLVRGLVGIPGVFGPLRVIGNFVIFGSEKNTIILEGYSGQISPMRELILLMRVYKYLLDNNIDGNVYSAIKDVKFDYDMYGIVEPEYVDLGLSVKWATFNVGATKPEEQGDYFAWGETEPKEDYSWETYKFRTSGDSYDDVKFSKYNTDSSRGVVDNNTVLDLEDDVAHVKWGGNWRMPTLVEQQELLDNCSWEWTSNYNGTKVSGRIVTSNKAGYTDKSIFLPVSGFTDGKDFSDTRTGGYYWSSSLSTGHSYNANHIHFYSGDCFYSASRRSCGRSVRAVCP